MGYTPYCHHLMESRRPDTDGHIVFCVGVLFCWFSTCFSCGQIQVRMMDRALRRVCHHGQPSGICCRRIWTGCRETMVRPPCPVVVQLFQSLVALWRETAVEVGSRVVWGPTGWVVLAPWP